jgi:hypothetical protein
VIPTKPEIVRTRLRGVLLLMPGVRGISAQLRRWRIHKSFFTYELLKRIHRSSVVLVISGQ